ncbi:Cof-type HAD-IIB family hydrolase [Clostridium sp. BJN0001]|uniref:Cof-type HAD-IIB family hydrolase n=1 Tax=Clostridium sp. BJN0001 TaxID=2930219 RepID=UPI001FD09B38|nr:Cof-type HAD-IIB family hydrolase [Clostridium sp. BJN0001]
MNKNIIFFDIDGTLVSEKTHTVCDSAKKALKMAKEKGNLIFINTGRPVSEIDDELRKLDFDGYICGCGTYIEYEGKVLFYKGLGNNLSKKVASELKELKIDGILEGRNDIYYDREENIKSSEVKRILKEHRRAGFYKGSLWDDSNINFDKFVVWYEKEEQFKKLYEEFSNLFDFIHRDDKFYEIVPKGFSKATGIRDVIKLLDIPKENTYSLGDSTNDLEMLEFSEHSIAMGNSHKKLFDICSYVTDDIEENGIYNALEHYSLI